jgi:hypothetical protein
MYLCIACLFDSAAPETQGFRPPWVSMHRKLRFNQAIHALRDRVERTCAWEDKFTRLLLRFEYHQRRHDGLKLMAYMLLKVRRFCEA